jgi:hypothetical protein
LSSTLDVKTRDGNKRKYQANGGIGTIFSRFTLEGPLTKPSLKDFKKPLKTPAKSSFIVSGRRSYIDLLAKPFLPENLAGSQFYFYDLTAKANYSYKRDNIYISTYIGEDVFFCQKAAAAGFKIWIDHDVSKEIGHIGTFEFKHDHTWVMKEIKAV